MANLGKSVSKLLSPRRYTSFSVSPRKKALHSPGNTESRSRDCNFSKGADIPTVRYSPLQEKTRVTYELSKRKANQISKNLLQIPRHELPLITSPVTKKLIDKGLEGINSKQILGRGRFGTVIKGLYQDTPVAVKIIQKTLKKVKEDLKEENAMKLVHPNINRVLKTLCSQGNYDLIMMEYINGTNLLQKLNDTKFVMDKSRIFRYALELGHALQHCHRNKIIHLDVKPENVIIDSEDHCKLCDFGSSRILDNGDIVKAPWPGTPTYAAPEVLKGCYITCSADIYSFGITLWQLLAREIPYFGEDIHTVIYKVVTQNHRPRKLKPKNREEGKYIMLYEKCWMNNYLERPTADEAVLYILQISE